MLTEDVFFYQEFISAVRDKIPHHAAIVKTITDILDIDKDAVYRRLRGDVDFSFTEMAIIARELGISLDNIARIRNISSGKPARLYLCNHTNPTDYDYEMYESHIHLLKSIKDEPGTSIMDAGNIFPIYLFLNHEYITRFYLFRWCQANNYGSSIPFHEITIHERLKDAHKNICEYARHVTSTLYMFNYILFDRFVKNVHYYHKIRLVNDEDVSLIKNDLIALLNYIENLAVKGKYTETGKEVSIYLSDIAFDANYFCLKSSHTLFTMIRVFLLDFVVSYNSDLFKDTYTWIRTLQRTSTLISVSGEKLRTEFFDEQRKIIDTL